MSRNETTTNNVKLFTYLIVLRNSHSNNLAEVISSFWVQLSSLCICGTYYYYYCFFYSQKELGLAKSYLQFFFEKSYK